MRILYTIILYLFVPVILLKLSWSGLKNRDYWTRWNERFGYSDLPAAKRPRIWLHAVSVGEVQAAVPLVQRLQTDYPEFELLVTTMTPTGSSMVRQRFDSSVLHTFLPYDLPDAVNRFLDRTRPVLLLVLETEIWPNLYYQCAARNIRVLLVNARLSEKSFAGYKYFGQFTSRVLGKINLIAAQSATDAARLAALGADRSRIIVTGNIKFDINIQAGVFSQGLSIRRLIGASRPVWIAASTHEGEERIVLAAHRYVTERFPDCLLILAPRHPERCAGVAALCQDSGYIILRKTQFEENRTAQFDSDVQVYILDTIGELQAYYAAADIAFVGGRLLTGMGGSNVLEPASLGIPVIFGKHTDNFKEIGALLCDHQAARQISDRSELETTVIRLLGDESLRKRMGSAGKEFVRQNQGCVERVMQLVTDNIRNL